MDHKTYQPKMPDIMEAVFDAIYLLFDLVAGIVFFSHFSTPTQPLLSNKTATFTL